MPSKTFKVTTLMNFTINIHSTVAGNLSIKQSVSMTPCEKKNTQKDISKYNNFKHNFSKYIGTKTKRRNSSICWKPRSCVGLPWSRTKRSGDSCDARELHHCEGNEVQRLWSHSITQRKELSWSKLIVQTVLFASVLIYLCYI